MVNTDPAVVHAGNSNHHVVGGEMSATLRKHLRERHGMVTIPQRNAACVALHHRHHHRLVWSHIHHGGMGVGPNDRPEGWTTGEEVEERKL